MGSSCNEFTPFTMGSYNIIDNLKLNSLRPSDAYMRQ